MVALHLLSWFESIIVTLHMTYMKGKLHMAVTNLGGNRSIKPIFGVCPCSSTVSANP